MSSHKPWCCLCLLSLFYWYIPHPVSNEFFLVLILYVVTNTVVFCHFHLLGFGPGSWCLWLHHWGIAWLLFQFLHFSTWANLSTGSREVLFIYVWGLPGSSADNESACNAGDLDLIPGLGKIPWRRERLSTPVFWPGEFHELYSPRGHKESDMTEQLSLSLFIYVNLSLTSLLKSLNDSPVP